MRFLKVFGIIVLGCLIVVFLLSLATVNSGPAQIMSEDACKNGKGVQVSENGVKATYKKCTVHIEQDGNGKAQQVTTYELNN